MLEKNQEPKKRKPLLANYARYSGIVFQMLAIIGLFTYLGYKVDQKIKLEKPWVTAASALVGIFIALYSIFKQLKS